MFCPMCGKEIEDDSRFCEFCGAKLDEAQPTLSCEPPVQPQPAPSYVPPIQPQTTQPIQPQPIQPQPAQPVQNIETPAAAPKKSRGKTIVLIICLLVALPILGRLAKEAFYLALYSDEDTEETGEYDDTLPIEKDFDWYWAGYKIDGKLISPEGGSGKWISGMNDLDGEWKMLQSWYTLPEDEDGEGEITNYYSEITLDIQNERSVKLTEHHVATRSADGTLDTREAASDAEYEGSREIDESEPDRIYLGLTDIYGSDMYLDRIFSYNGHKYMTGYIISEYNPDTSISVALCK